MGAIASLVAIVLVGTACTTPTTNRPPISEIPVSGSPPVSYVPSVPSPSAPPPSDGSFAEGTQPSQGPLVFVQVIDWVGSDRVTLTDVTFHMTEHCTYLQGPPEEPVLLIWGGKSAWVDPNSPSTMHFRDGMSGEVRHLTDGQTVSVSGYSIGGDGYQYDPRPHPSCPMNGNHVAVQELL
jgi:hypothetical protein